MHENVLRKCTTSQMNESFNNYFKVFKHGESTRNNEFSIKLPAVKLEIAKNGFYFAGGQLYNSLPINIGKINDFTKFKELV